MKKTSLITVFCVLNEKNLFEEQSTTSSREQDGGTYRGAAVGEICIRGGHAVEDYVVSCRYALTPHVNIDFSIANLLCRGTVDFCL